MSAGPTTPRHVTFQTRAAGAPGRPTRQAHSGTPMRGAHSGTPARHAHAGPHYAATTTAAVPAATRAAPAPTPRGGPATRLPLPSWRAHADVIGAAALIVVAAGARLLPTGTARIMLTLPVLLLVPGYLLLQAMRSHVADHRIQDILIGIGLSLPVVGLAALLTSLVPNGFTPTAIVAVTTILCLGLAAAAILRRRAAPGARVNT